MPVCEHVRVEGSWYGNHWNSLKLILNALNYLTGEQ